MTHVSRPFQVGLAAVAVLAAVWLVALRGHSSPSGSSSAGQRQAPQSSAPSRSSSSPYTGSAPGIAGLTRAIEKARGAVALSEQNGHQLQQKSEQASSASGVTSAATEASSAQHAPVTPATHGSTAAAPRRSAAAASSASKSAKSHAKTTTAKTPSASRRLAVPRGTPAMQAQVEAQLKAGKIVAILFWNPHAVVDQAVRSELKAARGALRGQLAVDLAEASQAGAFGSFTHAVQVLATPTILLVNPRGQTRSLSGLTDSFSLQQAISEARG